jgi:hypothetical protein
VANWLALVRYRNPNSAEDCLTVLTSLMVLFAVARRLRKHSLQAEGRSFFSYRHIKGEKGKVVPVLNSLSTTPWRCMRECRYNATILDLGTRWRLVVSFMLRPFNPREITRGTHFMGGWVDPRVGLDAVEKRKISCPRREWNLCPSLYWLSYPGSLFIGILTY